MQTIRRTINGAIHGNDVSLQKYGQPGHTMQEQMAERPTNKTLSVCLVKLSNLN